MILVSKFKNVNVEDGLGRSPLYLASYRGTGCPFIHVIRKKFTPCRTTEVSPNTNSIIKIRSFNKTLNLNTLYFILTNIFFLPFEYKALKYFAAILTRVSLFAGNIRIFSHFVRLRKYSCFLRNYALFCFAKNKFWKKGESFAEKNIWKKNFFNDIIKLLMLSSQSKEFHFFALASFSNVAVTKLMAFAECFFFAKFRFGFTFFRLIHICEKFEISRKSMQNTNKNFRIFSRTFSCAENPNINISLVH